MHGFQQIEKKAVLWNNLKESQQIRLFLAAFAVGAVTGLAVALIRLNLGIPGHKALFWMIPVVTMRLVSGSKLGATAGTIGVVLTTFSLGGHLAGGPLGLGMILLAGVVLDVAMNFLEQRKLSNGCCILLLGTLTMFSNLICLVKKLFVPHGMGLHLLFSYSDFWFRLVSYAFFGFISGIIAWFIAFGIQKCR